KAQLALARGDLEQCDHLLISGETELRIRDHALATWRRVDFRLVRIRREAAAGRYDAAMALVHETHPLVEKRGDSYLRAEWALERAVLSINLGDFSGGRRALDDFVGRSQ